MSEFKHNSEENYIEIIQRLVKAVVVLLIIIVILLVLLVRNAPSSKKETISGSETPSGKLKVNVPSAHRWNKI